MDNKKLGRNDPCPCKSGKKYKKCCDGKGRFDKYGNIIPPPGVKEAAQRFRDLPSGAFERGGFLTGRPFIDTEYNNKRARAVGSRIYFRPLHETFHEFILDHFANALGYKWIVEERIKSKSSQHFLATWFEETGNVFKSTKDPKLPEGHVFGVRQSGNMRSLLSIAYDYYTLAHCNAVPLPKLIKRLKNKTYFQGARYEIAVAAIAIRAGFDITWLNLKTKHCEFIAKHKYTSDVVAFEAKSHHREGVLAVEGSKFDPENARVKILDHIREALDQLQDDIPLVIFDDLNLPITPKQKTNEKKWFKDVDEELKKYKFYDLYKETRFGALFITNFSWHFNDSLKDDKENEVMGLWHVNGKYSLDSQAVGLLKQASEQYGFVPAKLEERGNPQITKIDK